MSMTSTELLHALNESGAADATIDLGHKAIRHGVVKDDNPHSLIQYFKDASITEGTIHKAHDLLSGKTTPEHYQGTPPKNSSDARTSKMLRMLVDEFKNSVRDEQLMKQAERQAEAQGAGIGNPTGQKENVVAQAKARAGR